MAVLIGTTSRQVLTVARWMLAGLVVILALTGWWPTWRAWGALAAGLLAVWALWLIGRASAADRGIPGHPAHLAMLVPAVILLVHLAPAGLVSGDEAAGLRGAFDLSMIFQLALLSLGVLLSQSLLPRAARHAGVLSVCGASVIAGSLAAVAWGPSEHAAGALTLMGFAGVAVWLAPLWGGMRTDVDEHRPRGGQVVWAAFCVGVAVSGVSALAVIAPFEALLAAGVAGLVVFVAGLVFPQRRKWLLIAGGALAVAAAGAARALDAPLFTLDWLPTSLFGAGEQALREVSARDTGLKVLARVVGGAGTAWLVAGLAAGVLWRLWHARKGHWGDQGRAIVWTTAAGLAACALFSTGGLFIPSVSLVAAFTWGLMPAMLGRPARQRPGAIVLVVLVVLMVVLGLAREHGLLGWAVRAYRLGDNALHAVTGFLLAMVLVWLVGATRLWRGLAAIAFAALLGGAGEVAQWALSQRTAEYSDWLAHACGALAAAVPYLLLMGARGCESPDLSYR